MERRDGAVEAWARALGRLTGEVEERLGGTAAALRRRFSGDRPLAVLPYRGYGTGERVYVSGRVVEDPGLSRARPTDAWYSNLAAMYRRMQSSEVAGARVGIRLAGTEIEAVTDAEGYYRAWIEPAEPLDRTRAWHGAEIELRAPRRAGQGEASLAQQVLVPPAAAAFGVISDMDDTVLQSNVASFLRAARLVLLENAHTRMPFHGVAAFYRALQAGTRLTGPNPIFYVSKSPWNLYDVIVQFLERQEIPLGPVLLRDWDLVPERATKGFKMREIEQIFATYPGLPFILIGDTTQKDPEIYREVMRAFPGRVLAVYIRNVAASAARSLAVKKLSEEAGADGVALILAEDTQAMAAHAAGQGWIDSAVLPAIAGDARADEGASGTARG